MLIISSSMFSEWISLIPVPILAQINNPLKLLTLLLVKFNSLAVHSQNLFGQLVGIYQVDRAAALSFEQVNLV